MAGISIGSLSFWRILHPRRARRRLRRRSGGGPRIPRRRALRFEVYDDALAGDFRCSHGRDRYRCEECGGRGWARIRSIRGRSSRFARGCTRRGAYGFDPGRVLGVITRGRWHVPTKTFVQDVLPIFEQYSQTHSLWNPTRIACAIPSAATERSRRRASAAITSL